MFSNGEYTGDCPKIPFIPKLAQKKSSAPIYHLSLFGVCDYHINQKNVLQNHYLAFYFKIITKKNNNRHFYCFPSSDEPAIFVVPLFELISTLV